MSPAASFAEKTFAEKREWNGIDDAEKEALNQELVSAKQGRADKSHFQ